MRDLLVTAIVFGSLPFILFWRPYLGALMWVWISMMNPHRLSYGFAFNFPFAQVIAITTLLGLLFTNQRRRLPLTPVSGLAARLRRLDVVHLAVRHAARPTWCSKPGSGSSRRR